MSATADNYGFVPDHQDENFGFVPDDNNNVYGQTRNAIFNNIKNLPSEALSGGIGAARGLGNTINKLGSYFDESKNPLSVADTSVDKLFPKFVAQGKKNPASFAVGNFLGPSIPLIAASGPLGLADASTGVLPMIGRNMLANGAYSQMLDPTNPISGLLGSILGGAFSAIPAAQSVGAKRLTQGLEGRVNQAAKRLGVNLPLGDAAQNASAKFFGQNVVAPIPGSGMNQVYQGLGDQLTGKLGDVLTNLKGSANPEDINPTIVKTLKDNYADAQEAKRTLYNDVNSRADQIGVTVRPDQYNSWAKNLLNEENQRSQSTPELSLSEDVKSLLEKASKSGPKSFKDSSLLIARLNEIGNQQYLNGNKYISGQISEGRNLLGKDMEQSAYNAGDPDLKNQWDLAQKNYENNIAPYDEPSVAQYLKRKTNPDLVVQKFVKTGQYAQPTLLNHLLSKLPPEQQSQVGYSFLTKNMDFNPAQNGFVPDLHSLNEYDSLHDVVKNKLFNPQAKQTLEDLSLLKRQVPNVMNNPDTGKKLVTPAIYALLGGMGASALHGNLASLLGIPATIGGAALSTKALMSPWVRNVLTKSPKNAYKFLIPAATQGATTSVGSSS